MQKTDYDFSDLLQLKHVAWEIQRNMNLDKAISAPVILYSLVGGRDQQGNALIDTFCLTVIVQPNGDVE